MSRRGMMLWLLLPVLLLGGVAAGWAWLWHTQAGAQWVFDQARARLAETARAPTLEGRLQGNLNDGVRLHEAVYRDADVTVTAESAALAGRLSLFPTALTVSRIHLQAVEVHSVEAGTRGDGRGLGSARGDLSAPFPIIVESVQIDSAVVKRGGWSIPVDSISARGEWFESLSLEVTSLEGPAFSAALSLAMDLSPPFALESEVRVDRFQLPEAAQSEAPWLPAVLESAWTIHGDSAGLDLEGTVRWPEWLPEAAIAGRIENPLDAWSWAVEVTVPEVFLPLAGQAGVSFQGRGDDREFLLDRLTAQAGERRIQASGSFQWRSRAIDSRLSWQNLGWPLDADQPELSSPAGQARFSGTLPNWSLAGDASVSAPGWPQENVAFDASGDVNEVVATVTAPALFGGSLSVSGQAGLTPPRPWQADVQAHNLSLTALFATLAPRTGEDMKATFQALGDALPAEAVGGRIRASGRLQPLGFAADIDELSGKVRGRRVAARGHVEYGDQGLFADGLVFESGESRLALDGTLNGPPGLDLEVEIAALEDILPGSAGSLSGRIHYLHDRQRGFTGSRLRARLAAKDIQAFDWTVQELTIAGLEPGAETRGQLARAGVSPDPPLAVSVDAFNVTGPPGTIPALSAQLAGGFENLGVTISAQLQGARLEASVAGGAAGKRGGAWEGALESFQIIPPEGRPWTLRAPAAIRYAEELTLESACLTAGGESDLCVDLEHGRDGVQQGRVRLASVSPDLFVLAADWPLSFSQQLNGELTWTRQPGSKPSATAEFEITGGVIIDKADNVELLHTRDGVFRFALERGSLHSGDLDIPFDSGAIDIDFTVPDVLAGEESEVDGRVHVELHNLDALSNFVPPMAQTAGELALDITVGGTAGDPRFNGAIELHNGQMHWLAPGLRLSDFELEGRLGADKWVHLDGTFRAGEGRGELHAIVDLAEPFQPAFEAQLSGEALTLIDVPTVQLQADTDLSASWSGEEWQLSGRIHVPSARFAPRYLPSDTASESPDVVIVSGGEQVERRRPEERQWRIRGELEVSMGDDVVVDLDLAKATVKGKASFRWQDSLIPIANGQYDLQGEIQAYGQQLEITRASIRFPNVPADNPHLDIRAERRIYGNSLISTAGVLVNGTLKRPLTEPYTVPMTNADRARTLLITGSDFDYEQGVGAVNVGTYIAPKLYLSYGVGLFEEGNVISARYDLKSNFGIKATSGQNDTGIDVSYTIEK